MTTGSRQREQPAAKYQRPCYRPRESRFARSSVLPPNLTGSFTVATGMHAQPLTPKQLKAMVPVRALRGRPKSANSKQLVSVRYSPEVLAFFKATGEGWQSRMDGVLRHVSRRSRQA